MYFNHSMNHSLNATSNLVYNINYKCNSFQILIHYYNVYNGYIITRLIMLLKCNEINKLKIIYLIIYKHKWTFDKGYCPCYK